MGLRERFFFTRSYEGVLKIMFQNLLKSVILILLFSALFGCTSLDLILQEPRVVDTSVTVTDLSFTTITLMADITLYNPNKVSLDLKSFAYSLDLEGVSLFSGENAEGLSLGAEAASHIKIPLTLAYRDIFALPGALEGKNQAEYAFNGDFSFTLPVAGDITLPARKEGTFPLVRLPRFRFVSLKVVDLGMMGADIDILMETENPNSFALNQKGFEGELIVNNERWASLSLPEEQTIEAGEKGQTMFRIRLEFLSMGKTVRDLLSGEKTLYYSFPGFVGLGGDLEMLDLESLDLDLSGEIELNKPDTTTEGRHSSEKIEGSIEDNLIHLFGNYQAP